MSAHEAYVHLTLFVELTETVARVYDDSVVVADAATVTA